VDYASCVSASLLPSGELPETVLGIPIEWVFENAGWNIQLLKKKTASKTLLVPRHAIIITTVICKKMKKILP